MQPGVRMTAAEHEGLSPGLFVFLPHARLAEHVCFVNSTGSFNAVHLIVY